MLKVGVEPFLFHQLRLRARYRARRAVICVGYLGERIEQEIGHERFGIEITFSDDGPSPIGTLGAVGKAADALGPRFLVLYGDTYLRIDYGAWEASGPPVMMTVLRNDGQWDRSNATFDGERVVYDKSAPTPDMSWIDYGLGRLRADALCLVGEEVDDLADLYGELPRRGALFGYAAKERFYEIGTPATLAETDSFLTALAAKRGRKRS